MQMLVRSTMALLCACALLAGCAQGQQSASEEAGYSSDAFSQVADIGVSPASSSGGADSSSAESGELAASSGGPGAASSDSAVAKSSGVSERAGARTAVLADCAVIHDDGSVRCGVFLDISAHDFAALGFELGDSVDVSFSNGVTLEDVPFYNGNYAVVEEPQLVSYPDAEIPKLCLNHGEDLWVTAGLSPGDTATVTLRMPGAYADVQEAFDADYSVNREDYPSDAAFANYRALSGGNLKEGVVFRSASPIDNYYNRPPYANALMAEDGIAFIMDLSDNDDTIWSHLGDNEANGVNDDYFQSLYENGQVVALGLDTDYKTDEFAFALASGLNQMAQHEGPYLVHCVVGRDRTGFTCALIEALVGASYDEIARDYMLSYENYYGVTEASDPEKYATIKRNNLDPMLRHIAGVEAGADVDLAEVDLSEAARRYLQNAGMTDDDVDALLGAIQ